MFVVLGAAGNIGFATSRTLREANVTVRAILRDEAKAARLQEIGCEIAVADLRDVNALALAMTNADAVQVILPAPSPQGQDGAQDMRDIIESITAALQQTRPKCLLAVSDYGAHIPHDIGMPTLFHAFELRLSTLPGHKIFLRSAEHTHNWGRAIPAAIASGTLMGFHDPTDAKFPTVSASDVGVIAANLLLRSRTLSSAGLEIVHAEGPERYSARDVAAALGQLVGQPITAVAIPRAQWRESLERAMNPGLATLLIKASDARNQGGLVDVEPGAGDVRYGTTSLTEALQMVLQEGERQRL